MTSIDTSNPGQHEALRLGFVLLIEDMNYSMFAGMPFEQQLALAENAHLDADGLVAALRYLSEYARRQADGLREYMQSRSEARC